MEIIDEIYENGANIPIKDEESECPICFSPWKGAVTTKLDCHHILCEHCLENYIHAESDERSVTCPMCDTVTKVSNSTQMSDVQKRILVRERIEEIAQILQFVVLDRGSVTCGACGKKGRTAVMYCKQCDWDMCQSCLQKHENSDEFDTHITQELPPFESCVVHKGEMINVFCTECELPLCSKCLSENRHQDHSHDFIQNIAPLRRDRLKSVVRSNENSKIHLSQQKMLLFSMEEEIETSFAVTNQRIQNWESALHEIIKSKAADLRNKLQARKEQEIRDLRSSMKSVEGLITCYEELINCVRQVLTSASDTEVVIKSKRLSILDDTDRLETAGLVPAAITEPTFDGNPAIEHIELTEVSYKQTPFSLSVDHVIDPEIEAPPSPRSPPVEFWGTKRRLCKEAELVPGSSVWDVVYDEPTQAIFLRTNDERKPIKLYDLQGKNIGDMGSSILVGDSTEGCMCIDRRGHVLVTTKTSIIRYDKTGRSLGEVTNPRFGSLRGIAYSQSCNVYLVSDIEQDCVLVVDPSTWNVIRQIGSRGDGHAQFVFPTFIAADNARCTSLFAISDGGNECIKVFDVNDGRFVESHRVGAEAPDINPGAGGLRGLKFDSFGGIIACDRYNKRVVRLWIDKTTSENCSHVVLPAEQLESEPNVLDIDESRRLWAVSVSLNRWTPNIVNLYRNPLQ